MVFAVSALLFEPLKGTTDFPTGCDFLHSQKDTKDAQKEREKKFSPSPFENLSLFFCVAEGSDNPPSFCFAKILPPLLKGALVVLCFTLISLFLTL